MLRYLPSAGEIRGVLAGRCQSVTSEGCKTTPALCKECVHTFLAGAAFTQVVTQKGRTWRTWRKHHVGMPGISLLRRARKRERSRRCKPSPTPRSPPHSCPRGHSVSTGQPCQAVRMCPERQTLLVLIPPLSHSCDWGRSHSHPCDSPLERPPASPVCALPRDRSGASPFGCYIHVIPACRHLLPLLTETNHCCVYLSPMPSRVCGVCRHPATRSPRDVCLLESQTSDRVALHQGDSKEDGALCQSRGITASCHSLRHTMKKQSWRSQV
jgi:hypothetical protein